MQYVVSGIRNLEAVDLRFDAADSSDARRLAEAEGVSVIAVKGTAIWTARLGRTSRFPLLAFSQSLFTLLSAGLSLVESIEALAEREPKPEVKRVMRSLLERLFEGQAFSTALERHPDVFPALYVATMRANETTGALPEAIERFVAYRSQIDLVKKRVIAASIYPSMILCVGALVILFLLLYVVPRFSQVFEDLGNNIPYMSRVLLDWGRMMHDHGGLVLLAMLAAIAAFISAVSRPATRARIGRAAIRIPKIGEYVRVYQLARFYRTLGMLLRGGIPIVAALDMVIGLLPNAMRASLQLARQQIREGQSLSSALETEGLSTPVALRMMRVGEKTGKMGEMMDRIASFHDDDVAQAIDWFIRLFEPILMMGIGIIIGVIVLLMYAPIFELAGSIQ